MARNLEAGRTAKRLAEQEVVVMRLRAALGAEVAELEERRRQHREAVSADENWS